MVFNGTQLHIEEPYRDLLAVHGLDTLDGLRTCELGEIVSQGRSIVTRRIKLPEGPTIFLKKYHYGFKRSMRYWCRTSRAQTEWQNLEWMRRHDIPVPDRIAFAERRQFGRLITGIVLVLGVPDTRDFLQVAKNGFADWSRIRRRNLVARLANLTAHLHRLHYYDRDLHFRNWLIADDLPADESAPSIWVIDSPSGGCKTSLRRRRQIRDLADLDRLAPTYLRRAERMRFMREYLGLDRLTESAKELVRAVLRYNQKHSRHG